MTDLSTISLGKWIGAYIASLASFAFLDMALYLPLTGKRWNRTITDVQGYPIQPTAKMVIAGTVVYLVMALSVLLLLPYSDTSRAVVFAWGVIVGALIYSIFNGTNLVLFDEYSLNVALLDTIWGSVLYGTVFVIAHAILVS